MKIRKVYELMSSKVTTASPDSTLSSAIEKLAAGNISSLVITADGGVPVGIITERDVAKLAVSMSGILKSPLSGYVSQNLVTIFRNADVVTAIEMMQRNRIRRLVVTERDGSLAGIITYSDILKDVEEDYLRVNTTIDTVMTVDILKAEPNTPLGEAVERMSTEKKSCILVMAEDAVAGILTERDIVRLLTKRVSMDAPLGEVCTRHIIYVNHQTSVYEALKIMVQHRIRRLVILDDRLRLKGVVTQTDILNLLHENVTKSIKDQLQRFKDSLDALNTGYVEVELSEAGTIIWINRHGAGELGFGSVEEASEASFSALLADRSEWTRFLEEARGKSTVKDFAFHVGEKVFSCTFNISRLEASGIFRDVTGWVLESRKISDEKKRLDNILKSLSEGILIIGADGVIKEANAAAAAMFDSTSEEMIGRSYYFQGFAVVDERGAALRRERMDIDRVLETGLASRNVINGFKRSDGSVRWLKAGSAPVEDASGSLLEVVTVFSDITDIYNLEKRNKRILDTAREGYWEVGLDGTIRKANMALSRLLGCDVTELEGGSIYDLVDDPNRAVFKKALERRGSGVSESYEIVLRHKNGSEVHAIVSASPQAGSSGNVEFASAFITDVTELKATHNMLHSIASFSRDVTRALTEREAHEIFRHYLMSIKRGDSRINAVYLISVDSSRHYTEEVFSYNDSGMEPIEKCPSLDKCKAFIYSDTFSVNDLSSEYSCPIQRFGAKSGSMLCATINVGGSTVGLLHLYSLSPGFFTNETTEMIGSFTALLAPVINNMRLIELNRKLALIDPLTGLYNRRYFEAFVEKQMAISRRNNQHVSLIMLDLDNFKFINDTMGHEAGDLVLKMTANVLNKTIRFSDISVRYGGEEFIIALPNTDGPTAFDVAERMRTTLEITPVMISSDKKIFVTASFGVSVCNMHDDTLESLTARADEALYQAKKAGKNRTIQG